MHETEIPLFLCLYSKKNLHAKKNGSLIDYAISGEPTPLIVVNFQKVT